MVGPVAKREAVAHLQAVMGLSERRACGIVGADRKMVRYRSCRPPDTELRGHLRELANARRRFTSRCGCSQGREEGRAGEDSQLSDPLREGVSAPSACSPSLLAETL